MIRNFNFLVLSILVSALSTQAQTMEWRQIGLDIEGEEALDLSGYSVSSSADGSIVAIGARYNDGNGNESGHVRIYQNLGGTWTQVGNDIDGEAASDWAGNSVSLSSDGSIVAIGAPGNDGNGNGSGHVRVFTNNAGTWEQIGADIDGEDAGEHSGSSVSLSSDGSVVAIGAKNNADGGYEAGQVRIYKNNSGAWEQVGADIQGVTGDQCGSSVSLSSDGSVVAIGYPGNDIPGENSGQVKIFKNNAGTWEPVGSDIPGEAEYDNSGFSVSLSSDGSIVAIGAPNNDGSFNLAGHVRIYKNNAGSWEQVGADIDGKAEGYKSGSSVSLNSDGSIVAIGASLAASMTGKVGIYKNNAGSWEQVSSDLAGEWGNDFFGHSVSINSDGTIVAIGAYGNDGGGYNSGHAKVYGLMTAPTIVVQPESQMNICPGEETVLSITSENANNFQWILSTDDGNNWSDLIDDAIYSGTDTDSLTVIADTSLINNQYACIVSNAVGKDTSNTAGLSFDDEIPAILSLHNDTILGLGLDCELSLPDFTGEIIVTDNCDHSLDIMQSPLAGTIISGATNEVTITVTDNGGNQSEVSFNVEVVDQTGPIITSTHSDQIVDDAGSCEITLADYTGDVVATDNCDANPEVTQNPVAGTTISGAINIVTLTVTDDSGNESEVTFNVEVADTVSPDITSTHNNQTLEAGSTCEANLPDYTGNVMATDNCDTNPDVTQNPVAGTTISGAINEVTLTATDDSGNESEVTFNVEVADNEGPVITSTHNDQIVDDAGSCEITLADYTGDVVATDNCDANPEVTQNPVAGTTISGAINVVTLTATDDSGNESEVTFNVEVADNESPVITCINDTAIDLTSGTTYIVTGTEFDLASSNDNCGVDSIINNFNNSTTLAGGEFPVGTTTVMWRVFDDSGNESECTFNVTVNSPVGLETIRHKDISLYPNPVKRKIYLKSVENIQNVKIYDLTGKIVIERAGLIGTEIDISNLLSGVYIINISTENNSFTTKIIKE